MAVRQQDRSEDEPRDAALERAYAAGRREEPASHLDAAILAAARREVHAGPRRPGSMLHRWRAPVALAAVLVLSVTVVLLMREEGAVRLADSPAPTALPAPAPAAEGVRAAEDARVPRQRAEHTPQPKTEPARPEADSARSRDAAPAAVDEDHRRKAEAYSQPKRLGAAQEEARPSPRPFADAPVTPAEPKLSAPELQPAPSDALAKRAQPAAPAGQALERSEREQQPAQRPASPSVSQGPPAAAAPDSAVGSVTPQTSRAVRQGAAENALEAREGMRADVAAASRPVWQGYEAQPPEKWLERVEELHRAGRGREAREMLAEFRKRFPQHPVPATLVR